MGMVMILKSKSTLDHSKRKKSLPPIVLFDMHHQGYLWISFLLHTVNLILFTVLLVHPILHTSPHHSHHRRSHHLSLPQSFTPRLIKRICSTDPFVHNPLIPPDCLHGTWTLTLWAERQSARMSKIANDSLTRSCTGCFEAVPIWQQSASKA